MTAGFDEGEIIRFRNALLNCGKLSVDAFLEHRAEYRHVGKAAIASALIHRENVGALTAQNDKDWYRALYKTLNAPFDKFLENKVAFITLNFDRSLETFLFNALMESYGKSPDECAAILNKIPFIHVYGKLDDLPWQVLGGRSYHPQKNKDILLRAAERIRIIHEDVDVASDDTFRRIVGLLSWAQKICFIGFGYDSLNLKRLDIKSYPGKLLIGTSLGLSSAEIDRIRNEDVPVSSFSQHPGLGAAEFFDIYSLSTN